METYKCKCGEWTNGTWGGHRLCGRCYYEAVVAGEIGVPQPRPINYPMPVKDWEQTT